MAPRLSVSQISTLRSSFADDVRDYAAAGLDGIGVWELKLGEGADAEALELLAASGLESARRGARPSRRSCRCRCSAAPRIRPSGSTRSAVRSSGSRRSGPAGDRLPDRHRRRPRPGRGARDRRRRACATIAARGGAPRPAHRARAVPARSAASEWTIAIVDPRGGRADPRRRRPAGARDPVRRLAPLEHRRRSTTTSSARSTASSACTSADYREPTRGWADRVAPRRGRRRRAPRSSARSTRRAGTGSTTSRSSPTTARSAPSTRTRSGRRRPTETLARARAAFEQCWSA